MNTQVTTTNADVLKTITVNQTVVDGFNMAIKAKTGFSLKQWPKAAGERPTDAMLTAAVLFSKQRKCGAESLFLAMQMRPQGSSLSELACIIDAGPAHNHTRDTERAGHLVRSKGGGRFMVTLTAKGQKALEKAVTVQMPLNGAGKAADTLKAKKATKVAGTKTLTSKAKGGNGKRKAGSALTDASAMAASHELNASTLAAVQAELAERNAELEPMAARVEYTPEGATVVVPETNA